MFCGEVCVWSYVFKLLKLLVKICGGGGSRIRMPVYNINKLQSNDPPVTHRQICLNLLNRPQTVSDHPRFLFVMQSKNHKY